VEHLPEERVSEREETSDTVVSWSLWNTSLRRKRERKGERERERGRKSDTMVYDPCGTPPQGK
jgi:hypothetical protein